MNRIYPSYLKDLKLARKRGILMKVNLMRFILKLITGKGLPTKNRDHVLSGNYNGFRECHVTPDWLLIYSLNSSLKIVTLVRTGSHSDLF